MQNFVMQVQVYDEEEAEDRQNEVDGKSLKQMMSGEYPDSEIDKLLETFSMSGSLFQNVVSSGGEFIENDIRLNESIREAIEEVK